MKTLNKYLLIQVLASLVMTVLVFTLVLLLGNALKELLPLLMNHQATLGMLARAVGLLIPFVAVFALPISMLTATLLVFGRFSADQELTAARASGISLLSLISPVLILSLALCAVSAAVNLEIAPRCRVAYNRLRTDVKAAVLSQLQLPEGRPIDDIPGYKIFIGKNRRQELQDVLLYQLKDETNIDTVVRAPRGRMEVDKQQQKLILHLYDATIENIFQGQIIAFTVGESTQEFNLGAAEKSAGQPGISDLTFAQLQDKLRLWDREHAVHLPPSKVPPDELRKLQRQLQRWNDMAEPIRVQIHWQVASSFACFSFALIGIPLGIRVHRRETNVGVMVALVLVAIYYALFLIANSQSTRAELAPHLWMWVPNFLFQAVGVVLLWRSNRGI